MANELENTAAFLRSKATDVRVFASITSTSTALKAAAASGAGEGLVYLTGEQTAGRGRMGRSFFSPAGTGVYLSILLHPTIAASEIGALTASAAVAAAETVERFSGKTASIKWVNDVLLSNRKVCGILTEGGFAPDGRLEWAVVGAGVNLFAPEGGFPQELGSIAGAVLEEYKPGLAPQFAAALIDALWERCRSCTDDDIYKEYVRRSSVLGQPVWLVAPDGTKTAAEALAIERDFSLRVRLEDKTERTVASGEVSLRRREELK